MELKDSGYAAWRRALGGVGVRRRKRLGLERASRGLGGCRRHRRRNWRRALGAPVNEMLIKSSRYNNAACGNAYRQYSNGSEAPRG